ncbi:MAG: cobalamin-dependent protein [Pirellulales bacterium]|nr:cobalamin-dependent protein [Pirellulales bacterium]
MNPMELYHNQVTRVQGPFSLRMFHRSWGLMFIQSNIDTPCTLLDFPTLDRFIREIRDNKYDVVGISSILLNILKVRKMCELVRHHLPKAEIVVGGHIANLPDLNHRIDADYIVRGEGVRWFREFLNENPDRPYQHPMITSGIGTRNMGIRLPDKPGDVAATIIPSVGCPLGCNFCSTSAMFGGKGKFINFYETGDELFEVMCQIEETMHVQSFFVMDENFLLHRKRALRLLELIEENDKAWSLYVFSSANVLCTYTMEQLVGLGVSWVWMGLEGENCHYNKLHGVDAHALVQRLQANGIHVLGSSIIGLENHTPDNMDEVIDYAVRFNTDFHQFMLYTPLPGTPLYDELDAQGLMKNHAEYDDGDIHGQSIFNYRHPHIKNGQETEFIERAFLRDFEVNGPSVVRVFRTTLAGWKRYKNHPNPRIRRRFSHEIKGLATTYSAAVSAARIYYRKNRSLFTQIKSLQRDLHQEFGFKSRLMSLLGGPYIHWKILREERRLAKGWIYEPPTFYDRNYVGKDGGQARMTRPLAEAANQVRKTLST